MTIFSDNGLINFGEIINSYKQQIRPEEVLTKEVLERTYPLNLKIKLQNGTELEQPLRFYFCEDNHRGMTQQEYNDFTTNTNYEEDERVFFVK